MNHFVKTIYKRQLFLLILICPLLLSQKIERNLGLEKWVFSQQGKSEFLPAKIPGTIHTNLYRNKKIEHPFLGDNEKNLQWIEDENWIYKTEFQISENELQQQNAELIFHGLDTYADVFLNGILII